MMTFGIERYIGTWQNSEGYRLEITKVDDLRASASLASPSGGPVERPYFENKLTVDMIALYDDYVGVLRVDLWRPNSGFILELVHEPAYDLDDEQSEAIVPALSQYEEDTFLDQFHNLFGRLSHFTRYHIARTRSN